jgi:hypothetical protein
MAAEKPDRSLPTSADPCAEPREPRLGILHILIGTACVAVYLGLIQTVRHGLGTVAHVAGTGTGIVLAAMRLLQGVGSGSALGGLVLWATRRTRGRPFPKHPGEYLLVVLGISSLLGLVLGFVISQMMESAPFRSWERAISLYNLVVAIVWIWGALVLRARRWRAFFFLAAAFELLSCVLLWAGVAHTGAWRLPLYVLVPVVLAVVVVKDHRQGLRYPWTHWLGVGVQMWIALVALGWYVVATFFLAMIMV